MIFQIILVVGIIVFLVFFLRRQSTFTIVVSGGKARLKNGSIPGPFVQDVEDICRRAGIASGTVSGVGAQHQVTLRFSSEIPPQCHQQIRNAWATYS